MKRWIALLALFSAPAFSQGFFGLQLGESSIDPDTDGADQVDYADTSLKLFGGAAVNPLISAEFGFIDFGEYSAHYPTFDESHNYEATALYAAAVLTPRISNNIRLLGKAGLAYWDIDASVTSSIGISGAGSESGINPMVGVGVEFTLSPSLAIRAEYERYQNVGDELILTFPGYGSTEPGQGEDIDVAGVSAVFSF